MKTFEELGVSPEIRRAIEEMGYACPMPVQEEVIPYLLGYSVVNVDLLYKRQTERCGLSCSCLCQCYYIIFSPKR